MEKELEILVISALLHDIGKFAQRANRPHSKEMESVYLTSFKGKPGHWHTVFSDYFLEKGLPLPVEEPPTMLPSGWAAVLCLYDLR